jgi:hypothetical protein
MNKPKTSGIRAVAAKTRAMQKSPLAITRKEGRKQLKRFVTGKKPTRTRK